MLQFDQSIGWEALEKRLAETESPRQRQLIQVVIDHARAEAVGDIDGLMATLVAEPEYHFWGPGGDRGPKGADAVRGVLRGLRPQRRRDPRVAQGPDRGRRLDDHPRRRDQHARVVGHRQGAPATRSRRSAATTSSACVRSSSGASTRPGSRSARMPTRRSNPRTSSRFPTTSSRRSTSTTSRRSAPRAPRTDPQLRSRAEARKCFDDLGRTGDPHVGELAPLEGAVAHLDHAHDLGPLRRDLPEQTRRGSAS